MSHTTFRTRRFARMMRRRIAEVLHSVDVNKPEAIDPPEIEFDDPLSGLSNQTVADYGATLILCVMRDRGRNVEIDYANNRLWMDHDGGRIELVAPPAPLTVALARALLACVDQRSLEAGPQRLLTLPDGRQLTVAWKCDPLLEPAATSVVIAGFGPDG